MRPSTAGHVRSSSAFEQRPLGRSPMPMRLQAAVASNNVASSITSLKAEILLLQRRVEEARGSSNNSDMEALEQRLMMIPKDMDEQSIVEAKCSLMEILLELIKKVSISSLEKSDPNVVFNLMPTRTSAFLHLVDYVLNIGARRKVWDERVSEAAYADNNIIVEGADGKPVFSSAQRLVGGEQQGRSIHMTQLQKDITTIDLALNEPTAAEVRKLAAEQRILQDQLRTVLERQVVQAKAPVAEETSPAVMARRQSEVKPSKESDASAARVLQLQKQIDALNKEAEAYKKRIAEMETRGSQELTSFHSEEIPEETLKRIRGLSLGCDASRLIRLGVSLGSRPILQEAEAQEFKGRLTLLLNETNMNSSIPETTNTSTTKASKALKNAKPDAGNEPALWFALHQQSLIQTELLNRIDEGREALADTVKSKDTEIERLARVVTTLEQRIQAIKLQSTKAALSFEAEATRLTKDIERYKKLFDDFMVGQATNPHRIVNAKGQIATAEEREKTLREEVNSRQQSIGDLTGQLKILKNRLDQEKESAATVTRERHNLMQLRTCEASKVTRYAAEARERQEELDKSKDTVISLKKELREKTVSETELREKAWKLDVELHIAQNVIGELRQRQKEMVEQLTDCQECASSMQREVVKLRDEIVEQNVQFQRKLSEVVNDKTAATNLLLQEQKKIAELEREMEDLRIMGLRMESLEQNFTNYAASKLAQREASDEEQRTLNECLDALEGDTFALPCARDGEAQLQLAQKRLVAAKEQFENDDRIRSRQKATSVQYTDDRSVKKKLATVLLHRYTCIQLIAVTDRLRQLDLEQTNRENDIEIRQLNSSQDALLVELSQIRIQCDSLEHRNMELELERKQFVKNRSQNEADVRNLKANVQRLRVSHEEQEKMLVDVGSRLQSSRMALEASQGIIEHLPHAIPEDK